MKVYGAGKRCNTIEFLKKFDFFQECSPFDWDVVGFETVIKILNEDFANYCDDLYLPWQKEIINNTGIYKQPATSNFKYLKIKLRNHKHFGVNLNTIRLENMDSVDVYANDCGQYVFHYDFSDVSVIQKKQRRIKRFLDNEPQNTILFHITRNYKYEELDETIRYYKNLLDKCIKPYHFVIVICFEAQSAHCCSAIINSTKYNNHKLICFRTCPLHIQLENKANDNNVTDRRIQWNVLSNYLKKNKCL